MPPMKKNTNELMTYRIPIFLWSVVVSHSYSALRYAGAAGWSVVVAILACPQLAVSVPVMLGWTSQTKV